MAGGQRFPAGIYAGSIVVLLEGGRLPEGEDRFVGVLGVESIDEMNLIIER